VHEVLPNAGSISYKDMHAALALHLVLVRCVFHLYDCDMIPLLPLFSRHFWDVCKAPVTLCQFTLQFYNVIQG